MIFTDWSEDVDALQFMHMVRARRGQPGPPTCPIVVVSSNTDWLNAVFKARDSGMTEYLAKPISQKMVMTRIKSAIGNPRMFVEAGEFFGPDRRRAPPPDRGGRSAARTAETERRVKTNGARRPPSAARAVPIMMATIRVAVGGGNGPERRLDASGVFSVTRHGGILGKRKS